MFHVAVDLIRVRVSAVQRLSAPTISDFLFLNCESEREKTRAPRTHSFQSIQNGRTILLRDSCSKTETITHTHDKVASQDAWVARSRLISSLSSSPPLRSSTPVYLTLSWKKAENVTNGTMESQTVSALLKAGKAAVAAGDRTAASQQLHEATTVRFR